MRLDWVGLGKRRLLRLAELGMIMGWVGRAGATIEALAFARVGLSAMQTTGEVDKRMM